MLHPVLVDEHGGEEGARQAEPGDGLGVVRHGERGGDQRRPKASRPKPTVALKS